jgi:hypothetical protein
MTLTGLAADFSREGGAVLARRLSAIAAMLVGALVGALLVIRVSPVSALILAMALVVAALVGATSAGRSHAAWSGPR